MAKLIKGGGLAEATPMPRPGGDDPEVRVERARALKAQKIAEAEEERLRFVEAEEAAGWDEGRRAGLAEAERYADAARRRAQQEELGEDELLQAAMKGARAVIETALREHPETIVDIVRNALHSCRQQREVFVRANVADVPVLQHNRRRLVDVLGRAKEIDIREDPDVARGGCIIQTESATVDATIGSQLEAIESVLRAELLRARIE